MELAKRNITDNLSELAEHFTLEDVRNNLYFLMLLNLLFAYNYEQPYNMIQVIDPQGEDDITFYTPNKFLEVYDLYGLDGFIN